MGKFRLNGFKAILRLLYFFECLCEGLIKKIEFKLFLEGHFYRGGRAGRGDLNKISKYLKEF